MASYTYIHVSELFFMSFPFQEHRGGCLQVEIRDGCGPSKGAGSRGVGVREEAILIHLLHDCIL